MAADSLNQLGKNLGRTKKEIKITSKHVSKNFPLVEGSGDLLGTLYTYQFEFKTYTEDTVVLLDIVIKPRIRIING